MRNPAFCIWGKQIYCDRIITHFFRCSERLVHELFDPIFVESLFIGYKTGKTITDPSLMQQRNADQLETFEISVIHYVNVSVLIKFSQKTSVLTLIIVSSP